MTNDRLLIINIFFLLLELVVIYLLKNEILAMEYGWEGRFNQYILTAAVVSQVLFLYMIYQVKDEEQQRSMYLGHLVYYLAVGIWIALEAEVHFLFR